MTDETSAEETMKAIMDARGALQDLSEDALEGARKLNKPNNAVPALSKFADGIEKFARYGPSLGIDPALTELAIGFATANKEGISTGQYDAVVAVGSLITHFTSEDDQRKAVQNMLAALKPGSLLMIGVYDFETLLLDEPYDFVSSFGVFKDRPEGTTVCMQRRRWHGSPRERVHKSTFYGITSDKKMRTLTMDARAITHRELESIILESGAAKTEWLDPSVSHYYQPICVARKK